MSHPTTKGMADNKPANEPANGPAIECSVCGDEGTKSTTAIVCGDSVCHSCITEMFTLATEDESNYPPQWASHKLDIADFLDAIPVPVQHQFRTKSKEWEVKPVDRMYCQVKTASELPGGGPTEACGAFAGERVELDDVLTVHSCAACHKMSCMTCAEPIPGEAWRHVCDPSKLRSTNDNDDDTFADLQRGRDYQICPSKRCGRKIQLKDGCNHVHCYCGAQFCYICGEATTHHSDHWRETCPRYNQPGAGNAQFDPRLHPRLQRDREHNEGARDPRVTAPLSREADMARLFALGRVLTLNPGGNRGRGEQVDAMRHTAVLRVAGIPPP